MTHIGHSPTFAATPVHPPMSSTRKVALGCGGLLLLGCLFGVGLLFVARAALRSSDAYELALDAATHDPSVIAELGTPMHPGWLPMGQVSVAGTSGEANLAIPLSGPRAAGTLNACATKSAGKWALTCLNLQVSGRPAPLELLPATP